MEHVKSVLEASVDYHYPNHPEPEAEPGDMGEVSDGYHTFNELYRYRMLYNAVFFNLLARNGQVEVCKSRRHSDGEKCFGSDDWFIVMAILPTGQVSNHYESKYWDLFDVPERETAFEYDGHTPNEAADRLKNSSEVILRNDIVDLLSTRRELRKTRRNRLRYRKPRFNNRIKSKRSGWIAPSVKYKVDAHIRVIDNVCSILPIFRIVIEVAQFDTQKIKNPNISGKESFSFNRALVENLIETFETMQNIYSDNYRLKVYTGNCIIQLNVNPKDPSESFFDVYDRDEMKLIYGIKISILKEMFII